jgi:hypothetical protein
MLLELQKNPYRFFFPIAMFFLLLGSGLWIRAGVFQIGDLPIEEHANLFVGGYLFYAILGFLLTAIPQFTKTSYLSHIDMMSIFTFMILNIFGYLPVCTPLFWMGIFFGMVFLINFLKSRLILRLENPPYSFVFVFLGAVFGLVGSFLMTIASYELEKFGFLESWGKVLFFDSMVTCFVLGIGITLIPGILGHTDSVKAQKKIYEEAESYLKSVPNHIYICLLGFTLSVFLEAMELNPWGYVLRAFVITFLALKYWSLFKPVATKKWHGRMIKVACWFLIIGSWTIVIFNDYVIHMKHFIYVGTYILLTLMISTRVILAHAKESLDYEYRKLPYLLIGGLVALAACTRATAFLLPDSYNNHLGYAGLVLFFAAVVWGIYFLGIVFKKASHE